MVLFFPVSSLFESSGNLAAEFSEELRDGIATHVCNVWSRFPGFVTQGSNPASSFARGYMNSMCAPVQPPVPAPDVPFLGGQCCDGEYEVVLDYQLIRCTSGDVIVEDTGFTRRFTGRLIGAFIGVNPTTSFGTAAYIQYQDCNGVDFFILAGSTGAGFSDDGCVTASSPPVSSAVDGNASSIQITSVARVDGEPDFCGNPPSSYPEAPPQPGDLTTVITINNNDGVDNNYTLEWNQINPTYNFPMNFKLNGTNVMIDVGGITIFGDPSVTDPNDNPDALPPGSDGGKDETGTPYVNPDTQSDSPVNNDPVNVGTIARAIEYLVCEEGVIEPVQETIRLLPGVNPIVTVLLELLSQILTDVCGGESTELGFPDVYPVLPGVERPSIVFYYKEFEGERRLPSTYTTTVTHPSTLAIANINTMTVPDKQQGKYISSLRLLDGSRVLTTGIDQAVAESNLDFFLGLVSSSFIPGDIENLRVVTIQNRLEEKTTKCVQIEYYPDGKAQGVSPAIVRRINPLQ